MDGIAKEGTSHDQQIMELQFAIGPALGRGVHGEAGELLGNTLEAGLLDRIAHPVPHGFDGPDPGPHLADVWPVPGPANPGSQAGRPCETFHPTVVV